MTNEELVALAQKGDIEARNKLIEKNIKFIHLINNRMNGGEEGFQNGVFGLIKSIKQYDETKGKFLTYSAFWIQQFIIRGFQKNNYEVSYNLADKYLKYKKLKFEDLTDKEIMEKMKISQKTFNALVRINEKTTLTTTEFYVGRCDEVENIEKGIDLENLMKKYLTDEEIFILKKRYYEDYTLTEIGKILKYSKEYIRVKEQRVLAKLRRGIWRLK